MKINLKTTNFSLTPSIENYLEQKLSSVDKFLPADESILADVELSKTTKHHQKGDIFKAEINLKIPRKLIKVVAKRWNLKVAINEAMDKLERDIKINKEKNTSLYKKGARMVKKFLRGG